MIWKPIKTTNGGKGGSKDHCFREYCEKRGKNRGICTKHEKSIVLIINELHRFEKKTIVERLIPNTFV